MKIVYKISLYCNKFVNYCNMYIFWKCLIFVEDRDNMFENILEILDVYKYVLFDNLIGFWDVIFIINGVY